MHGPSSTKTCSLLTNEEFDYLSLPENVSLEWLCSMCINENLPFSSINDNNLFISNIDNPIAASDDLIVIPDEHFKNFSNGCNSVSIDLNDSDPSNEDDLSNNINSMYYSIHQLNQVKFDQSSLGIMHTNLASLNKHIDDLSIVLSLVKFQFDVVGITEHKIQKDTGPISNINIPGYHPFLYDPIQTSHGGAGFYIKDTLNYVERNDLKFHTPGICESIFIEIIFTNKKNILLRCIYRHPNSAISVDKLNDEYMEP